MWYMDAKPETITAILPPQRKLPKVKADTERTKPRELQRNGARAHQA